MIGGQEISFKDRTKYNIGWLDKYEIDQTENSFHAIVYIKSIL